MPGESRARHWATDQPEPNEKETDMANREQDVRDYVADQHKTHAKSADDRFTEWKVRNGGERHPIDPKRSR